MTVEIPKENWNQFFKDVSKRCFSWETRIEVESVSAGIQVLSNGLYLNGIAFENKFGTSEIEISVSKNMHQHHSHKVLNPLKVSYLREDKFHDASIEMVEADETLTSLKIFNPMPIMVSDAAYHSISTVKKGKKL